MLGEDDNPGAALDWWMTRHAQTNKGMAKVLDVSHTTILRFRRGLMLPSLPMAERIADYMTAEAGILYRVDDVFPERRLQPTLRTGARKVAA